MKLVIEKFIDDECMCIKSRQEKEESDLQTCIRVIRNQIYTTQSKQSEKGPPLYFITTFSNAMSIAFTTQLS